MTNPHELSPELKVLLFCMSRNPSKGLYEQAVAQLAIGVNDESLYTLAATHGLQMVLYGGLIPLSAQFPALGSLVKRLEEELTISAVLFEFVYPQELEQILRAFSGMGIDTLLLKGYALGEMLYGQPLLRSYSDFDLLVRVEHLEAAEQQMIALEYQLDESQYSRAWYREKHHHLAPFIRAGALPVEIHWNLVEPEVSGHMQIDLNALWAKAQPFAINGASTRILCPEHLLIHLSIHAITVHFFEMGLKPLGDVCAFLQQYHESLDWELLVKTSLDWHCERQVYLMLRLVTQLFEIQLSEDIFRRLSSENISPTSLKYSLANILSTAIAGLPESSGLAQTWQEKNVAYRLQAIIRRLFPSRTVVAEQYQLHSDDLSTWFYYPVWQFKFIQRHFKNALSLLRADKATLESARYETMRRELLEWLSR